MRRATPLFRLSTGLAVAGLLLGPLATTPGFAQPAPPAQPDDAAAQADPPARVGRLARISGTVSFRTADEDHWNAATLNYPITSGNYLWTEPEAGADIEVGSSRLTMAGATELEIARLDEQSLTATLGQGRLFLSLPNFGQGNSVTLRTPRGTVTIAQAGRYQIAAGDAEAPTQVTVVEGAAQIEGDGVSLAVGTGQTATITGNGPFEGQLGPQETDPFLAAQLARAPRGGGGPDVAPPPVVLQMTGAQPLLESGEWARVPEYGQVWYPPVAAGWVPYRNGHWAWVSPWGWTWVDEAPWGFAPFHYGRWVQYSGRWGWVPAEPAVAEYGPPVYAPALVSWVDVAAGAAVGLAAGLAIGAAVGWIPLGPREPYRPWYRTSRAYFGRVNRTNVVSVTNITNVTNINTFVNRGAGSFGTPGAVAGSPRPGGQWRGMTPQMLAAARPLTGVPVRPTLATPGVTPTVARQFSLPPAPPGSARPGAPGPAVATHAAAGGVPLLLRTPGGGAPPGMPTGVPGAGSAPAGTAGARSGQPAGAASFHQGLPALAPPGAGRPAAVGAVPPAGATFQATRPPGPAGSQTGHSPGFVPGAPSQTSGTGAPQGHSVTRATHETGGYQAPGQPPGAPPGTGQPPQGGLSAQPFNATIPHGSAPAGRPPQGGLSAQPFNATIPHGSAPGGHAPQPNFQSSAPSFQPPSRPAAPPTPNRSFQPSSPPAGPFQPPSQPNRSFQSVSPPAGPFQPPSQPNRSFQSVSPPAGAFQPPPQPNRTFQPASPPPRSFQPASPPPPPFQPAFRPSTPPPAPPPHNDGGQRHACPAGRPNC